MSVTNIQNTSELAAARDLRKVIEGRVVVRGGDDYVKTRQIWNRAVEHQPTLFAVLRNVRGRASGGVCRPSPWAAALGKWWWTSL